MLMLRKINNIKILEADRLLLRTWDDNDLQTILAINQDPKVMKYFPELQDLETTKKLIIFYEYITNCKVTMNPNRYFVPFSPTGSLQKF